MPDARDFREARDVARRRSTELGCGSGGKASAMGVGGGATDGGEGGGGGYMISAPLLWRKDSSSRFENWAYIYHKGVRACFVRQQCLGSTYSDTESLDH